MSKLTEYGWSSKLPYIIISELNQRKGPIRTWCDRFGQYGIKVSLWGSGTLKTMIYVENHPHRPILRLDYYHPLGGWG